jgi:hypothetical protein
MRRTKIIALITLTAVSVFLLSPLAKGRPRTDPQGPGSGETVAATFLNIGGGVFQPGQSLDIKWTLEGKGVKYFETNPWSECELYYSADGGRTWSRISPHLSVLRRDFGWTIPDIATQNGMLALQIGIEGNGEFYVFPSAPFTVLPTRR